MAFTLSRATSGNMLFSNLESEWGGQIRGYASEFDEEYDSPHMDHARKIVAEQPPDPRYGIYVLADEDAPVGQRYVGMTHVNHAWPGTSHATLRMLWIVLAPRLDFEDTSAETLSQIVAAFLYKGIELSEQEMISGAMKMHLGNMVDRQFSQGLVLGLRQRSPLEVAVRGNWLHLEKLR